MKKRLHTKIYGTIGPACCDVDMLTRLFAAGMTGIRINLSHTGLREADGWLSGIHRAYQNFLASEGNDTSPDSGPEILMDLRGPELRIGTLSAPLFLKEGETIYLTGENDKSEFNILENICKNSKSGPACVPVQKMVLEALSREENGGGEVLLDDGKLLIRIEEIIRDQNECAAKYRVLRGGELKGGKSIALPGLDLHPPTLTRSDEENICLAREYGITGVMLPFVRDREDLRCLRRKLDQEGASHVRILAKIENQRGFEQLPQLIDACDEVVIARGDLGNAVPLWRLPVVQAQIASFCRERKKPFMVVTQMLSSMEKQAVPTRAEVSDIFRAVSEGAASVMLTGETAAGSYPSEAMKYMVNTVLEAEQYIKCHNMKNPV